MAIPRVNEAVSTGHPGSTLLSVVSVLFIGGYDFIVYPTLATRHGLDDPSHHFPAPASSTSSDGRTCETGT